MRRLRIVLPVVSVLAVVLALVVVRFGRLHPGLGQDARWVLHVQRSAAVSPTASAPRRQTRPPCAAPASRARPRRGRQLDWASQPPDERRLVPTDAAERDRGRLQPRRPAGGGRGRQRLRQRRRGGHAHRRRRQELEEHLGHAAVRRHPRLRWRRPRGRLQPPRPRLLPDPALLFPCCCSPRSSFKSVDNGKTWTPGPAGGAGGRNFDYANGTVDESVFHDKEYLTVDNHPSSPHYGRIYVTWTKFHIAPDGSSDFCPIQVASTDSVPTTNPLLATFAQASVVPDAPRQRRVWRVGQPVQRAQGRAGRHPGCRLHP